MRSVWLSILLWALVVGVLLSACQPDPSAPGEGSGIPSIDSTAVPQGLQPRAVDAQRYAGSNPTGQTVLFLHPFSGTQQEALQALTDDFNQSNAYDIRVQLESLGNYQNIFKRTFESIGTPEVPDLVLIFQNQAADLHLNAGLVDLNALFDHPRWGFSDADQADFFPGILAQDEYSVFSGVRLGFPLSRSADVLLYNRDWLFELSSDSPPVDSETFRRLACAAAATPFSRSKTEGSFGYELSIDASRFASWTFAFGGDLFDEQNNRFTLNDPGAVAAMQFLQELVESRCVALSGEWYGDLNRFGDGGLLFAVGSSGNLRAVQRAVEAGSQFDWSAAPLPGDGHHGLNVYGPSLSIPVNTPERELAAWIFVRYLTEPENQAAWAAATGTYPVRAAAGEFMAEYLADHPAYRAGFDLLQDAQTEPSVPGYDLVRQEIETAMDGIMAGANVQATLYALNQTANAILTERLDAGR